MKSKNLNITEFNNNLQRYNFKNEINGVAVINIFDEISEWWGVGVNQMANDLSINSNKPLHINLYSGGGEVFTGIAIAELIRGHKHPTRVHGISLVGSIATVIALSSDEFTMSKSAYFMIHEVSSASHGTATDLRSTADVIEKLNNTIADVYVQAIEKRGKSIERSVIVEMMRNETWLTAEECVNMGLCDRIEGDEIIEVTNSSYINRFDNKTPNIFLNQIKKSMKVEKKGLLNKLTDFFKNEIEPQLKDEVAEQNTEVSDVSDVSDIEKAKNLLLENGFEVSEKEKQEVEQPTNKIETLEEIEQRIRKQVESEFKAKIQTPPAGAGTQGKTTNSSSLYNNNKSAFDVLAEMVKH